MKILALLAALIVLPAQAAFYTFKNDRVTLTLTENICPAEVKENLKPEYHDAFHEAFLLLDGQPYIGCWVLVEGENVYVMLDIGESITVPAKIFKKDEGV